MKGRQKKILVVGCTSGEIYGLDWVEARRIGDEYLKI